MDRNPSERNIALLIDFENIAAGTEKEGLGKFDIDKVIARVKDKGRILISRSYADWGRFARFKQQLLAANVTMYELTSHGMQDKNRADIATVVDCLELAYTRDYIDTYVIVSGDSDFTPLVLKLKELNKSVIGIGTRRSTSRLIINACDEFIFYDTIVQKPVTARRKAPAAAGKVSGDKAKAFELVFEVLEGLMREDTKPPFASVLKSAVLRRVPDFSETDLGFSSFTRLLEAARDAGFVALERDKKSGAYTVDLVTEGGEEGPARAEEPKAPKQGGAYEDAYLPEGAEVFVKRLQAAGLVPVSAPTRMTVLEALVGAVDERTKKRRRITVNFIVEDLQARLRRTHPELSGEHLKGILRVLLRSGLLVHKDGAPIRNLTAPFVLNKSADQLNRALANAYLRQLRKDGVELTNSALLADFVFGDPERARDVEEMLAWMDAPGEEDALLDIEIEGDDEPAPARAPAPQRAPARAPAADADFDLDAFLLTDGEEEAPKPAKAPKAPKAERAPKAARPAPVDDLDAVLELGDEHVVALDDDALLSVDDEGGEAEEASEGDEAASDKPRKPRRRGGRRRKPAGGGGGEG